MSRRGRTTGLWSIKKLASTGAIVLLFGLGFGVAVMQGGAVASVVPAAPQSSPAAITSVIVNTNRQLVLSWTMTAGDTVEDVWWSTSSAIGSGGPCTNVGQPLIHDPNDVESMTATPNATSYTTQHRFAPGTYYVQVETIGDATQHGLTHGLCGHFSNIVTVTVGSTTTTVSVTTSTTTAATTTGGGGALTRVGTGLWCCVDAHTSFDDYLGGQLYLAFRNPSSTDGLCSYGFRVSNDPPTSGVLSSTSSFTFGSNAPCNYSSETYDDDSWLRTHVDVTRPVYIQIVFKCLGFFGTCYGAGDGDYVLGTAVTLAVHAAQATTATTVGGGPAALPACVTTVVAAHYSPKKHDIFVAWQEPELSGDTVQPIQVYYGAGLIAGHVDHEKSPGGSIGVARSAHIATIQFWFFHPKTPTRIYVDVEFFVQSQRDQNSGDYRRSCSHATVTIAPHR